MLIIGKVFTNTTQDSFKNFTILPQKISALEKDSCPKNVNYNIQCVRMRKSRI